MYKISVKCNVDGKHTQLQIKLSKMLKFTLNKVQTEFDHSGNATHSLWFTKLVNDYSATHPDPTHVMLMVIENKMVLWYTDINLNLHEISLLLFWVMNCKKLSKLFTNYIKPVVQLLVQKLFLRCDVFLLKQDKLFICNSSHTQIA